MASKSLTNTNVSETYVGVLHAEGAPLPASGKADIYDGFGNKSALSLGREGNGIEVSGSLGPNFASAIADVIYPIGSLFFSKDNNNPGSRMVGTSWAQVAEGQFVAGVGTGTDSNGTSHTVTAGDTNTSGEYNHTLTVNELPAHTHETVVDHKDYTGIDLPTIHQRVGSHKNADYAISLTSSTAGGNQSHNNLPPAFGMYVWERIA
jgi:hypothetical protein